MAMDIKMPSKKKTIIIISIIAVLAIIAVIGVAVFLKDKGTTDAADLENEQVLGDANTLNEQIPIIPDNGEQNQDIVASDGEAANSTQDVVASDGEAANSTQDVVVSDGEITETGDTVIPDVEDVTRDTTTTAGETGITTTTDTIQETTITRIEEVKIPERQIFEGLYVGWTPIQIKAEAFSAKIVAEKDDIEVTKKGNETVAQGDKVTYEITVTNKTDNKMKDVEVKDRLDANILDTTTVEFFTEKEGITDLWKENGTIQENVITWNVDVEAGQTITIIFDVTVKSNVVPETILKNSVVANGVELESPTETTIKEATTEIAVLKEWKEIETDAAKAHEINNLIVKVTGNGETETATISEDTEWKAEFKGLTKYDADGKEITYTITEEAVNDADKATLAKYYKSEVKDNKIINTFDLTKVDDTTEIIVEKEWKEIESDAAKAHEINSLIVKVTGNGETETATISEDTEWKAEFKGLTKYDADGKEITYTITEEAVNDADKATLAKYYKSEVKDNKIINTFDLTKVDDTTSVSGTKTWDDANNVRRTRPDSITLKLMQSVNREQATEAKDAQNNVITKVVEKPVVEEGTIVNTWDYTFDNLPIYDAEGKEITYSVVEVKDEEDRYIAIPDETNGMNITNRYPVEIVNTTKSSVIVSCAEGKSVQDHEKTQNGNIATVRVHEGDKIAYTITVENIGNETTTVNINDPIKAGLTYEGKEGDISVSLLGRTQTDKNIPDDLTSLIQNNELSLEDYAIDPGFKLTITFVVKVNTLTGNDTVKTIDKNVAVITNNNDNYNESDDTKYEVKKANITGTKTVDKNKADKGETLTYEITATNDSDEVGKLVINDDLGGLISSNKIENIGNVKVISGNENLVSFANNKITYIDNNFAAGATVKITFDVTVKSKSYNDKIINTVVINDYSYSAETIVAKKICVTAKNNEPIDLVLVLDVSGSMNQASRLSNMKEAAKNMVNLLFPDKEKNDSTMSIITFSQPGAKTICEAYGSDNKQQLINIINRISAADGTQIYEALKEANSLLDKTNLNDEKILQNREKVVVFLGDGAPTQPFYIETDGDTVTRNDYTASNTEANITEQAKALKQKATVYSIGLGITRLQDNRLNSDGAKGALYTECPVKNNVTNVDVTSTKSHTILRGENIITGNIASSGDKVTYTITLKNNSNKAERIKVTDSIFGQDITVNQISDGGTKFGNNINWNIELAVGEEKTLSYEATVDYKYEFFIGLSSQTITLATGGTTISSDPICNESTCFRADDRKYYHWESEESYARRILRDIIASESEDSSTKYTEAADGTNSLTSVFNEIFNDIIKDQDYCYVETTPGIVTFEEDRKLVGDTVQVRIVKENGTEQIVEYKISDIDISTETGKNGKDGLKYNPGVGFTWEISADYNDVELELIYTYEEADETA